MPDSRPQFSAVDARVRGRFRIMPSANDLPMVSIGSETKPVGVAELEQSKIPEPIINFLVNMSNQIDYIASLLEKKNLEEEFPYTLEALQVSGSGLAFHSDQPLETGVHLEVLLNLNALPLKMAAAVGKVVKKEGSPDNTLYVLHFTRISEQNLDAIVHFVFQEQRKNIREHHWE